MPCARYPAEESSWDSNPALPLVSKTLAPVLGYGLEAAVPLHNSSTQKRCLLCNALLPNLPKGITCIKEVPVLWPDKHDSNSQRLDFFSPRNNNENFNKAL